MKKNIRLDIAYDGTEYFGWQQTNVGPSIEAHLKQVLSQILQQKISLQAASRTDRGVHARCQVVNFFSDCKISDLNRFKISLNALLPKDISVFNCSYVSQSFHPTLDCVEKEYRYYICFGDAPFPEHQRYCWHYRRKIDLHVMKQACNLLTGNFDYTAFTNIRTNERYKSTYRSINFFNFKTISGNRLEFSVTGKHFMYKMVRNLVGTVYHVGIGKLSLSDLEHALAEKKRSLVGICAPAHGLFLHRVSY